MANTLSISFRFLPETPIEEVIRIFENDLPLMSPVSVSAFDKEYGLDLIQKPVVPEEETISDGAVTRLRTSLEIPRAW